MRRSSRVYLNEVNPGKAQELASFLHLCHDATQYFIDLFWERGDFTADLADLPKVHRGCERFNLSTRLSQALAKQAKETIRSLRKKVGPGMSFHKPNLRKHMVSLFSHFVSIEPFETASFKTPFSLALKFGGAGAPTMVVPCKSTKHLNQKLAAGWTIANTLRLGRSKNRLFVDIILEKPRPKLRGTGETLGLDSNYKNGLVTSDGQFIGTEVYHRIQTFDKRQKHTKAEAKSMMLHAMKGLDLSGVQTLAIENLKNVRCNTRGKFPRRLNRRLSHWFYGIYSTCLEQKCEELGIRLERKDPWKTSQRCPACGKWDKRSRKGDEFKCIHCRHSDHADLNAAKNIRALSLAGIYGFRSLTSPQGTSK